MSAPTPASPSSIEAKMNQIRALLARMQQDEGSLDESLALYEEATTLIAACQSMLDSAANRINNQADV
ncbi:MAG: exodeoxyribonuclease VII small subunit [Bacteroidia bacterium]